MCSACQDSVLGFGMPLTPVELSNFNAWRLTQTRTKDMPALEESPGVRYLVYGKEKTNTGANSGKQGSWDNAKFKAQVSLPPPHASVSNV